VSEADFYAEGRVGSPSSPVTSELPIRPRSRILTLSAEFGRMSVAELALGATWRPAQLLNVKALCPGPVPRDLEFDCRHGGRRELPNTIRGERLL